MNPIERGLFWPLLITATMAAAILAAQSDKPRPSGNCGPAAMGLTQDGDVVPIKVDRGGYPIPSDQPKPQQK